METGPQAGNDAVAPSSGVGQPASAFSSEDPFASLPRITPFTDFELDPIEPTNGNGGPSEAPPSAYTGRRRRRGEEPDDANEVDNGRHSRADERAQEGGRGRRRRHDGDENDSGVDLLQSLLAREGAEN